MIIDKEGIVSASKNELLAIWLIDDDLFNLLSYGEWVIRCKTPGVNVT